METCKHCGKETDGNGIFVCPACGAILCPDCAGQMQNICPYCYSLMDFTNL